MQSQPAVAPVIALVLAAGQGRRFGSDKRRALLADGTPLLVASLLQAQRNFAQVYVLLQGGDDAQALGVPPGVKVLRCADAELGMGHSLAAGIRALDKHPASAIAVLLGDMPWLSASTLQLLIGQAGAERIVFPSYQGRRGHPVLFGRQFWPQLQQLTGDVGAKALLAAQSQANAASPPGAGAACIEVAVDDPGVLWDVDTPEALRRS
ncbi:MAG: molybdopterin-guanine dinucleotide biosynthesis protein MobA [Pseudomonadales bacterium RIFCSPLOWO2_12_59_9]|nr:MAG: molybdopterin-guanine dinucleotide biosynthesis protein MobA [Pseudomonadales bacterium RIFCSPLOWO2_12_59_9]